MAQHMARVDELLPLMRPGARLVGAWYGLCIIGRKSTEPKAALYEVIDALPNAL